MTQTLTPAAQDILAQVDQQAIVDLASELIRIPSFKTEETPVARWLADFCQERGYQVDLQEVEPAEQGQGQDHHQHARDERALLESTLLAPVVFDAPGWHALPD